jgi:predicted DsbA family dithiol-disulfide isomerase
MSTLKPLQIDIVSDVVCPWCYIGKRRIENALALTPDVPVEINWRPFFLNNWVPREGISRDEYLTAKFGSPEAYKNIAGRVVEAANEEGLTYRPELVKRQPNTIDCHRLIHWADAKGKSAAMKQRLMELYFRDGGDLTDIDVLVRAAADCGLDADDVRRRLATDEDVALISAQAKDASDKGISGVPTFVFAQKYAVSGAHPSGVGGSERAGGRVGEALSENSAVILIESQGFVMPGRSSLVCADCVNLSAMPGIHVFAA